VCGFCQHNNILYLKYYIVVLTETRNCFVVYFNACTLHHTVFITNSYLSTRQTNTQATVTMDCIYSHINTLLAQEIVTSHGLYCITQRQSNNFNLIILWNCCFNSFNLNNVCNLAKYKFLKLPEGIETCMS
jgi:hypothetical protein